MIGDRNHVELSKLSGLSRPTISALKNRKREITINNLTALLPFLGSSLAEFFALDNEPPSGSPPAQQAPREEGDDFYRDQIRRKDKYIDALSEEVKRLREENERLRASIANLYNKNRPPYGTERRGDFSELVNSVLPL